MYTLGDVESASSQELQQYLGDSYSNNLPRSRLTIMQNLANSNQLKEWHVPNNPTFIRYYLKKDRDLINQINRYFLFKEDITRLEAILLLTAIKDKSSNSTNWYATIITYTDPNNIPSLVQIFHEEFLRHLVSCGTYDQWLIAHETIPSRNNYSSTSSLHQF